MSELSALSLNEKLFLIAIDDARGIIPFFIYKNFLYGLVGAILEELVLLDRLKIKDEKIHLIDPKPTGDKVLDEVLVEISNNLKMKKSTRVINALAVSKLTRQVAESLVDKGVIQIEAKRYRWVIPYAPYPEHKASAKYWVKSRLRAIVLAGENSEAGDIALLSLIQASKLSSLVFTKDERKTASKMVDELFSEDVFSPPVAKDLREIETSVAATILAATN